MSLARYYAALVLALATPPPPAADARYVIAPATLTESSDFVFSASGTQLGAQTVAQVAEGGGVWASPFYYLFEDERAAYGTADGLAYGFRFRGHGFTLRGYMGSDGAAFTVLVNGQPVGRGTNFNPSATLGDWFTWTGTGLDNYEVIVTKAEGRAFYCDTMKLF